MGIFKKIEDKLDEKAQDVIKIIKYEANAFNQIKNQQKKEHETQVRIHDLLSSEKERDEEQNEAILTALSELVEKFTSMDESLQKFVKLQSDLIENMAKYFRYEMKWSEEQAKKEQETKETDADRLF
jgi:lactam utilization protein B